MAVLVTFPGSDAILKANPMCGIAGFYLKNRTAEIGDIRAMCDAIIHRGPDDEGVRVDGGCAIGMRRLSIIDLSTGHQPISNEDGTVWIVFNGEVYNYQELRRDLIAKGHRFRTNSDTETIIHLYEEEGPEGVKKLRGMFAYAIWDSRPAELVRCARSVRQEAVVLLEDQGWVLFRQRTEVPSHIRSRLGDGPGGATALLPIWFRTRSPFTPFRQVRKLMPGCWIRYNADGRVEEGRYWRLPEPESRRGIMDAAKTAIEVREKFDESVKMRMIADVPLGAFLSGGIDSGSVVASMALQSKDPVKTFSIGLKKQNSTNCRLRELGR